MTQDGYPKLQTDLQVAFGSRDRVEAVWRSPEGFVEVSPIRTHITKSHGSQNCIAPVSVTPERRSTLAIAQAALYV